MVQVIIFQIFQRYRAAFTRAINHAVQFAVFGYDGFRQSPDLINAGQVLRIIPRGRCFIADVPHFFTAPGHHDDFHAVFRQFSGDSLPYSG